MTDQPTPTPTVLAREAKSIHAGLKESLKKKEPFDKDVDFQRKNLRRRYLTLLLVHPYADESHDAENHLWMQTSYLFISSYKQRISALDRILSSPQQQNGNHGPVEYRKLVQRFRQFLAEEDKFWTKLVLRFRRSFALDEAHPALVKLGLVLESDNGDAPAEGRNYNQFPPETISVVPSPEQREGRLNILSKALVCLGDIARYREVYNDGGGRSRIGHDDAPRRGRGRRGGPPGGLDLVRPRNYTKARNCYEQAKLLVATDGNPSHQLAILASYEKDQFMSLVHYYFALCVKQPYETAADNMGTIMHKALEQWKARSKEDKDKNHASEPPIAKIRIDIFKDKMVVLHGLWRLGLQKMDSLTKRESNGIYQEFKALLSERHLPEEFIPQILVTSQGALYTHRMLSAPVNKKSKDTSPTLDPSIVETRILNHLLLLHRALLEVGLQEIGSVDTVDMDLAQRITAPFRRTLGALRMSMKWLRANMKYMIEHSSEETTTFWRVLTDFIEILGRAFPPNQLPELTSALEEDREMEGFLPLRGLFARRQGTVSAVGEHPNVVHLMRIGDILKDAQLVAEFENSPFKISLPTIASSLASDVFPHYDQVQDDETMTETTDDVVAEAFGHLNEEDFDDDEEEQVLYPRASVSPMPPPLKRSPVIPLAPAKVSPARPSPPKLSPIGFPISPAKHNISPSLTTPKSMTAAPAATTAQDLLFSDVLVGGKRPMSRSISGEQPRFFPVKSETRSIWATASDEPVQINAGRNNHSPYVHPRSFGMEMEAGMQPQSQASWPPQLSSQASSLPSTQNSQSQSYIPGSLPSAPFALPPQSMIMDRGGPPPIGHGMSLNRGGLGLNFPSSSSPYMDRYPLGQQPLPPQGLYPSEYGGPEAYYSSSNAAVGMHTRHLSLHDPGQAYNLTPLWGPTG